MNGEVRALLRSTTLRVLDQAGTTWGTGFFIAPDLVMTAAHVLAGLEGQVLVQWDGGQPVVAQTVWAEPQFCPPGVDVYPAPDLAVLYVPAGAAFDHPCAMLDEQIAQAPGGWMLADGYTRGVTVDTPTPDPVTASYEGIRVEAGWDLIKCHDCILDPGMSGAPLLDLASGQVVGVVKAQRSQDLPAGLYAASVAALRICRPELWATSQMFHQTDRRWRQAIRPGSTVRDPKTATRSVLNATLAAVERRTWNLPPLVDRKSLHQTVWVRHMGRSGTESEKPEPGRASTAERFRWRPLREVGHVTVVRGLPGYGKSWLLAYHAEAVAKDSIATLDAGVDARRLRLPLLLNCASLAARLPTHPDEDDVVSALLKSADLPLSPQMVADECRNMTREAFSTGSLILCLDGLDEVPARFWSRLQRALGIIAAGSNTTLIATRHSALGLMEEVAEGRVDIEVLGFTSREASRFVAAWLEGSPEGRGALERALESSEALRAIASVPLFISFLCRLAQVPSRSKPFPTSKALLYQEVVEGLLAGNWRTAVPHDPDAPHQMERRLRTLADSLGALLDSWRSSGESVSRAELITELAKQPDYALLRATAEARWEAWQRANDAEPARTPVDPVLWEFLFDGLLVADSDAPEPTVRVLHPSLKDYLLSNYLSRMAAPAWQAALNRHRWFDIEWQEIFALASSMMPEADSLIRMILDVEVDPWLTQALFAARCVAEGGPNISQETAAKVVLALLNDDTVTHMFDRRRRDTAFSRLVRAHVGPAVSRALEICAADQDDQSDIYLEAACALAEAQHEEGLRKASEIFSNSKTEIPRRYRERLITALTVSENPAALDLVINLIDERGSRGDLDAFLIALRSQSGILLDTAVRLLRTRTYFYSARAAVAAALMECGDEAIGKVLEAADDATLEWGLRSQLFSLLINADTPDVASKAMSFLRNPSVRTLDRANVIEKLIRAGEFSMLGNAAALLFDSTLSMNTKSSLVRAVRDIGTDGVKLLRQQINAGLPLSSIVPHLDALIEMRDEQGLRFGVTLSLDPGVPAWIRGTALLTLLRVAPHLVGETAMQVAGSHDLTSGDRLELSIALARAGIRGAADAVRAALDDAEAVRNWPAASRVLAASGDIGRATLVRIAADNRYSWHIRTESVMALAAAQQEADVQTALVGISNENIPNLWRQRLVFGLTASGQPQFVAELIRFLPTVAAAYEIFFQFLQGPHAVLDIFFENMQLLHDAMISVPADTKAVALDDDLLTECGLTSTSESERRQLLDWFYRELQSRAGSLLNKLMLPQQLEEYQSYLDDRDEKGALDWLNTNFPEYWDFLQNELYEIKQDVINGRVRLVRGIPTANEPPQSILRNLRVALDALVELVEGRSTWDTYFSFLEEYQSVLLTDYAIRLELLACDLDPGWPLHEAHLFVLRNSRERGVSATRHLASSPQIIQDRIIELIDAGQHDEAYLAGSFCVLRFPDFLNGSLYAAISAEGYGSHGVALRLSRRLGADASDAQVLEAERIIREVAIRFDWEPASTQELLDSLVAGHSEGPDDEAFHYNRGVLLAGRDEFEDAIASYDRSIELGASYPEVHVMRAEALGRLGLHEEALAAYDRALELAPDNPNRHVTRSIVLHKLGRWEESLASCKRAVELEPGSPDWHNNEGEVLLMLGRLDEARASFREAVNLSATAGVESRVLLAALTLASAPEEAAELCREALRRSQDTVSAFRYGELRALAYLMLGNQDLAERELRSVATEFSARELLEPQVYRLLRDPWVPGLERLLAIWKDLGVEEL